MGNRGGAYEPIRLKALVADCDISQAELARHVSSACGKPVSRTTINLAVNRGFEPATLPDFKDAVERALGAQGCVHVWLSQRGLSMKDVWEPSSAEKKIVRVNRRNKRAPAMRPGNPMNLDTKWEVEMISQDTMKHFKIFRNPFIDDIQKEQDIYMSDEHRYIEAAMLDASKHSGFIAVVGEVGSGKTVIRRKVVEQLMRDGKTLILYPQMIDKTRLTAASICDAMVQDLSSEKCRVRLEDKTRQVHRLLLARAKQGLRAVLIIEEAHDLNNATLKYLKRFWELEDGFRKLLGIVLIGQTELKNKLDERTNVDMREVIMRLQVAEIRGLNGNLKEYLAVKFKRIGKDVAEIFTDDAYAAMSQRMTSTERDGKKKVSHAYPQSVNNLTARAMNLAYQMGEAVISADVVMAI